MLKNNHNLFLEMLSNTLLQLLLSREVVYTYKQQEAALSRQSYFYFQGFWGSELLNGCLVLWLETYIYEEYSNFQESKSAILKFSQKCFWDSWILVSCWFSSYFTLITKEKFHFSLIRSFYCCLVKEGWALNVA